MHLAEQPTVAPFVLACEASATLSNATELRARLVEALDRSDSVLVDLSEVEDLDMTFVQLLVSARKSAERSGKGLSVGASESSKEAIARASVRDIDLPLYAALPVARPAPQDEIVSDEIADHGIEDIDHAVVAKLANEIGEDALRQSLGVFFMQMASRLEVLRGLAEARNLTLIKRETHLLKGTAGTFGLSGLRSEVIAFEHAAATLDAAAYAATLDRMSNMLQRAQAALQASSATSHASLS